MLNSLWQKLGSTSLATTLLLGIAVTPASAAPGSLDPTFHSDGKVATNFGSTSDVAYGMAIQRDGKILVAGSTWPATGQNFALARYNPNGSLDATFGSGGRVVTDFGSTNEEAKAIAIQGDGKILVAGYTYSNALFHRIFAVARYNPNGSLDMTFGNRGKVTTAIDPATGCCSRNDEANAIAIAPNGKIVVGGFVTNNFPFRDYALVRYNPNGSLDTTFDLDGKVITNFTGDAGITSVAVQSDGKILAAGYASNGGGNNNVSLLRYNINGSPDLTFGYGGGGALVDFIGGSDSGNSLLLRPDGKIVVGGYAQLPCPLTNCTRFGFALVQFNSNGRLDTTFSGGGGIAYDLSSFSSAAAYGMTRLANGKLVLAGHIGDTDFAVARFQPNGSLDTSFGNGGFVRTSFGPFGFNRAYAIKVQADGKVVVAGEVRANTSNASDRDFGLARYLN